MAATEQPQEEEEGQGRKMNTFLHRVKRYLNVVLTSEKKYLELIHKFYNNLLFRLRFPITVEPLIFLYTG